MSPGRNITILTNPEVKGMRDRDSETWLDELRGNRGKDRQEEAFQDLGDFLFARVHWYLMNRATLPPKFSLEQHTHDITQDSLEAILKKGLNSYKGKGSFLGYARVIAINKARETLRTVWRRSVSCVR